jgi:acyl dehydratase
MGLNTDYIGYKTDVFSEEINKDSVLSYLSSIGSSNPYYENNNVAPHIFNVVQEIELVESIWKMEDLYESSDEMMRSVLMLVHGEQTMNFSRLIKFGETIDSYAVIENIQQKGLNNILRLKVFHLDSDKKEVGDSSWTLFIRASDSEIAKAKELRKNEPPKEKKTPREPQEEPKYCLEGLFEVEEGITYKYAEASKDKNPIHLDKETAKKAGLQGIIVHGLCTMAMVMDNIIDKYLSSNPEKISSVSLRFSSPVWPGDKLKVNGWKDSEDSNLLKFEVQNGSQTKVIKSGSLTTRD